MDMSMSSASAGMSMPSSSSMGSMDTAMATMTPTSSAGMSMSTATSMGGMSGMDMGSGACQISMLWNWYTVDACFLSSSWHVTSHGMFAGSCIGVICLVIVLEFLRRVGRGYDKYIAPKAKATVGSNHLQNKSLDSSSEEHSPDGGPSMGQGGMAGIRNGLMSRRASITRPTVLQQAIRATIHMLQFAVAYFIMLLAMYFNGYIIICIFIGAWIGSFIFSWDQLVTRNEGDATEVTGCCG